MKTEFIKQYAHTWRIFERVVKAFDQDAWIHTGYGTTTPARLAFHILQGVNYLQRAPGARAHLPVHKDAPLAAFAQVAGQIPVFRVVTNMIKVAGSS